MSVRILVISASETECLVMKDILNKYRTLTACDKIEAMELIDGNPHIDLLILDIDMPNMDGFKILNELNSKEQYKKLRTIILTSDNDPESEVNGLKLGAIDYIRKPIQKESFKVSIDIHIELLRIQRLFEDTLYEQSLAFDAIFQQAPIGIAISNISEPFNSNIGNIVSLNPVYEHITGRTKEEIIKLGWEQITHPDDVEEDNNNFKKLQLGEIKNYSMEKRYIKPDGSNVWVYMVVAKLNLLNEHKFNHICLVQDITERKAIEKALLESERSKSVLLSNLPGMAYRCNYDQNWTMQFVSAGCFELTGYKPENLLYNKEITYNDLILPEYRDSLWIEWKSLIANRQPLKYEYEIKTANGKRKWVLEMGQGVYNEEGEVEALEGIILDISDRKEIENNLRYNNEHDRWTGLHNRSYLENLLKNDAGLQTVESKAIIGINLSAMQALTMTYGFQYSQDLIKRVADALYFYCNDKRLLFKTYENRFLFYLKGYKDKKELVEFCEVIVNTLEPLLMTERVGGSIGILEFDKYNPEDIDQLLKNLLIASEKAMDIDNKDFGFCFFDSEMETQIIREETIKCDLAKIGEDKNEGGLFLQYQPIFDLNSNCITGFEALARLKSVKLGLVSPLEFIPIAEETKLIITIGKEIIYQALSFLSKLNKSGFDSINISINISAVQLLKRDFNKNIFEIINQMEVKPSNITLEITESIFADNYHQINKILGELKAYGIQIAIDDFGTGYSSLARERELAVDCIKIDKYFIDKLLSLNEDEAITGDIISMAQKLGHYVIAEGVEHERQKQYLKKHGCDKIQGYLISKPIDEEAAFETLKNQNTI